MAYYQNEREIRNPFLEFCLGGAETIRIFRGNWLLMKLIERRLLEERTRFIETFSGVTLGRDHSLTALGLEELMRLRSNENTELLSHIIGLHSRAYRYASASQEAFLLPPEQVTAFSAECIHLIGSVLNAYLENGRNDVFRSVVRDTAAAVRDELYTEMNSQIEVDDSPVFSDMQRMFLSGVLPDGVRPEESVEVSIKQLAVYIETAESFIGSVDSLPKSGAAPSGIPAMSDEQELKIKGAVFDMDGLLIDTEKLYVRYWRQAARELGYDMQDWHVYAIRSLARPYSIKKLKQFFGEDCPTEEIRARRTELIMEHIRKYGVETKPGMSELLGYLKEHGIRLAVATSTASDRTYPLLDSINARRYFDAVICGDMIITGKPDPCIYQTAAAALGLCPEECAAFEDSPNGIRSAHDAGCKAIMIPDLTPPDDFVKPLLSGVYESLDKAKEFFEGRI